MAKQLKTSEADHDLRLEYWTPITAADATCADARSGQGSPDAWPTPRVEESLWGRRRSGVDGGERLRKRTPSVKTVKCSPDAGPFSPTDPVYQRDERVYKSPGRSGCGGRGRS
jgi:hypothetical protein